MGSDTPIVTEEFIAGVWFVLCVAAGLAYIGLGARASGVALLGAILGSWLGFFIGAGMSIDLVAKGFMIGASVGVFVGGLFGLLWRSKASVVVLRVLGAVTLLVGFLLVLLGKASFRPCRVHALFTCLREVNVGTLLTHFALDAAWVAALCFIQSVRPKPVQRAPVDEPEAASSPSR